MNKLFLPILLGTAREGRRSELAARYVHEQAQSQDFETAFLDVREWLERPQTEAAMNKSRSEEWSELMQRADGLIIVTPEYNHGYPGELKIMLDQIYSEYANKAVAICGVSKGWTGGARVVKQLVGVVHTMKLHPIRNALHFPNVEALFDEEGKMLHEKYDEMTQTMFDELIFLATALKAQREK